jgi:hypothetical protein
MVFPKKPQRIIIRYEAGVDMLIIESTVTGMAKDEDQTHGGSGYSTSP